MEDYKSLLRDIFHSEELKIDSQYSKRLKDTIEKLCINEENDKFNKCFVKVCKDIKEITKDSKKKEPCFSKMYLYMTEKLSKTIEELPREQRDPIL